MQKKNIFVYKLKKFFVCWRLPKQSHLIFLFAGCFLWFLWAFCKSNRALLWAFLAFCGIRALQCLAFAFASSRCLVGTFVALLVMSTSFTGNLHYYENDKNLELLQQYPCTLKTCPFTTFLSQNRRFGTSRQCTLKKWSGKEGQWRQEQCLQKWASLRSRQFDWSEAYRRTSCCSVLICTQHEGRPFWCSSLLMD